MEKDWVLIKSTTSDVEAEFIKTVLTEADIELVVMDKRDNTYPTIGEIEIYTLRNEVIRAMTLIEQAREN